MLDYYISSACAGGLTCIVDLPSSMRSIGLSDRVCCSLPLSSVPGSASLPQARALGDPITNCRVMYRIAAQYRKPPAALCAQARLPLKRPGCSALVGAAASPSTTTTVPYGPRLSLEYKDCILIPWGSCFREDQRLRPIKQFIVAACGRVVLMSL